MKEEGRETSPLTTIFGEDVLELAGRIRSSNPRCWMVDDPRFFSNKEKDQQRVIVEFCLHCRAKTPCLEFGLLTYSTGVWGGTTDEDRIDLRRQRKEQKNPSKRPRRKL